MAINDSVNHPSHYTAGKVECIDALEAATEGLPGIKAVCTANAIKYLWRWDRKNGGCNGFSGSRKRDHRNCLSWL